jgi:molecular chaperone GrpE
MWPRKKAEEQAEEQKANVPESGEGAAEETPQPNASEQAPSGNEFQDRIAQLEAELDDARGRALRLMADFQNYQRRAIQNEVVAKQQGIAGLAGSLANVVDTFDSALAQTSPTASAEHVITGMRMIREELLKALSEHGVTQINPKPGDLFEPGRHEAVMQQKAEGVEPGHVVSTFQAGYVLSSGLSERVIRPAKVVVAPTE